MSRDSAAILEPTPEQAAPPVVRLVKLKVVLGGLSDMLAEAANRAGMPDLFDEAFLATMRTEEFQRDLLAELLEKRIAVDPREAAQYRNTALDGHPIAFFVRHFRLMVEARMYYQADLQRDSTKLFNVIRERMRHRDWKYHLQAADQQLLREGVAPFILGKRVCDMMTFDDLLPKYRNVLPRTPVEAAFERSEPSLQLPDRSEKPRANFPLRGIDC